MMIRALLILSFTLISTASHAMASPAPSVTPNPTDPCQQGSDISVSHVPDADVSYQPGVDVNGNAVAPADLGGTTIITPPSTVTLEIDAPINNVPVNADVEAKVGTITVDTNTGAITGSEGVEVSTTPIKCD